MRNPFDPFVDMRQLFRSIEETQRLLEKTDPLRSLREIQEQIRLYQPLVDSVTTAQLALQPVFPTDFLAHVSQVTTVADRIKELLPQPESLARLADATALAKDWLRDLTAGAQDLAQISKLQRHLSEGFLQPLPTAVEEFKRIAAGLEDYSLLEKSFATRMARALSAVVQAESPEELGESIDSAEQILLDQVEEAQASRLSREALLSVLLTLLLFVLDQASSLGVARETMTRIAALEGRILSRIEAPLEVKDHGQKEEEYSVVLRPLDVREEPNNLAKHLGLVYPGRRVTEIERRDGWIRIEFFADSSGRLSQGWVRRNGLQKQGERPLLTERDEATKILDQDGDRLQTPPVCVDDPEVLSGNWTWVGDQDGQLQFRPRRRKR
jgi:hypothetical protein